MRLRLALVLISVAMAAALPSGAVAQSSDVAKETATAPTSNRAKKQDLEKPAPSEDALYVRRAALLRVGVTLRSLSSKAFAVERRKKTGEIRRQHFEGDLALEARILGQVDLAHATMTEFGGDLVVRERRAGHLARCFPSKVPASLSRRRDSKRRRRRHAGTVDRPCKP